MPARIAIDAVMIDDASSAPHLPGSLEPRRGDPTHQHFTDHEGMSPQRCRIGGTVSPRHLALGSTARMSHGLVFFSSCGMIDVAADILPGEMDCQGPVPRGEIAEETRPLSAYTP